MDVSATKLPMLCQDGEQHGVIPTGDSGRLGSLAENSQQKMQIGMGVS